MKRIIVTEAITLIDPISGEKGETLSFQQWAFRHWMNDPASAKDVVSLYRWRDVVEQFKKKAKPKDAIELEDADYDILKEIANRKATIEVPLVSMQLLPFVDAVNNAESFTPISETAAAAVSPTPAAAVS